MNYYENKVIIINVIKVLALYILLVTTIHTEISIIIPIISGGVYITTRAYLNHISIYNEAKEDKIKTPTGCDFDL